MMMIGGGGGSGGSGGGGGPGGGGGAGGLGGFGLSPPPVGPGGAMPCQPGALTPESGSETTVLPSPDTVPVPLMISRPLV